jgi:hypothetical protein
MAASPKSLLITAGVALAVVVAHDKVKSGSVAVPRVAR